MKFKLFFLFVSLISTQTFLSSQNTFVKNVSLNQPHDLFTTDNQENIYLVTANELIKYDKTGTEQYRFSNKNLGKITSVDATNMWKIVVFYKEFQQIVILDNTLSLTGDVISLSQLGFQQIQLVCSSHNNGLWIYDQQNFELIRFDQNLTITQRTGQLNNIVSEGLVPDYLTEFNNKLLLKNPFSGIMIFDIYGAYFKSIMDKGIQQFQPLGESIYYLTEKTIKAYNINTSEEKIFDLPEFIFKKFRIELNLLFLSDEKSINVYSSQK